MEYKVIMCQQGKLEVDSNNITNIVIFPKGHSDAVVGGPQGPLPISIDIDKSTFEIIRANTLSIYKDFSKMWSDFSHSGATITSYLQDLVWDESRGIVAKVKLTKDGLAAAKNNILNFFSPSFKIDPKTNEILSLTNCFGGMTDAPALKELREYPITAMDQSNIYYNILKRKSIMNEVKTSETNGIVAEAAIPKSTEDKSEIKQPVKAEVVPAHMEQPKKENEYATAEHSDEKEDMDMVEKMFESLLEKHLPKLKTLLGLGEASCKANNAIKILEDKVDAINVEQCKIQDALKSVNKEEKEKVLRASQPIDNVDMPGIGTTDIIVQAEIASGKRMSPQALYNAALKIKRDDNCGFDRAWQLAKNM